MQPIKYLNGLGEVSEESLQKYDYLVVEDANGQRRTIPNPALQGLKGLGFLATAIGAGAKIIGGLINRRKNADGSKKPGLLKRITSSLAPQPAAAPAAGPVASAAPQPGLLSQLTSQFAGGNNPMLDMLKGQVSSLQSASNSKELAIDSFIDKQKEELSKQNNLLTQSNSEVQRMLDKTETMRRETEGKVQELRELLKAQETKAQLAEQEAKLKDQIRQYQQPDSGKMLMYVAAGAAIFLAARSLNGTKSLSGVDSAPPTGKKSASKIKTVTI